MGGLRLRDVTSPLFLLPVSAFGIAANTWIFDENWRLNPVVHETPILCPEKQYSILGITVTNLDVR